MASPNISYYEDNYFTLSCSVSTEYERRRDRILGGNITRYGENRENVFYFRPNTTVPESLEINSIDIDNNSNNNNNDGDGKKTNLHNMYYLMVPTCNSKFDWFYFPPPDIWEMVKFFKHILYFFHLQGLTGAHGPHNQESLEQNNFLEHYNDNDDDNNNYNNNNNNNNTIITDIQIRDMKRDIVSRENTNSDEELSEFKKILTFNSLDDIEEEEDDIDGNNEIDKNISNKNNNNSNSNSNNCNIMHTTTPSHVRDNNDSEHYMNVLSCSSSSIISRKDNKKSDNGNNNGTDSSNSNGDDDNNNNNVSLLFLGTPKQSSEINSAYNIKQKQRLSKIVESKRRGQKHHSKLPVRRKLKFSSGSASSSGDDGKEKEKKDENSIDRNYHHHKKMKTCCSNTGDILNVSREKRMFLTITDRDDDLSIEY
jgi:hypothetical protein